MKFKDPDSSNDPYSVDWTDELDGATIVPSSFTATPDDGITVDSIASDTVVTTTFLSGGGEPGTIHEIIHRVDASDGRLNLEKTQRIKIRER